MLILKKIIRKQFVMTQPINSFSSFLKRSTVLVLLVFVCCLYPTKATVHTICGDLEWYTDWKYFPIKGTGSNAVCNAFAGSEYIRGGIYGKVTQVWVKKIDNGYYEAHIFLEPKAGSDLGYDCKAITKPTPHALAFFKFNDRAEVTLTYAHNISRIYDAASFEQTLKEAFMLEGEGVFLNYKYALRLGLL